MKSNDYLWSDKYLNGFWVSPSSVYNRYKDLGYRLNPINYETVQLEQKRMKPYQSNEKFNFKFNNYEFYASQDCQGQL